METSDEDARRLERNSLMDPDPVSLAARNAFRNRKRGLLISAGFLASVLAAASLGYASGSPSPVPEPVRLETVLASEPIVAISAAGESSL